MAEECNLRHIASFVAGDSILGQRCACRNLLQILKKSNTKRVWSSNFDASSIQNTQKLLGQRRSCKKSGFLRCTTVARALCRQAKPEQCGGGRLQWGEAETQLRHHEQKDAPDSEEGRPWIRIAPDTAQT